MRHFAIWLLVTGFAFAQTHQPFQSQSPASVVYGVNKDSQQTVEITNVAYEVTSTAVPGRPQTERLLLRTTTRTREVVDEIGMEASTTVEAWPLGVDPKQKPIYTLKSAGVDSKSVDSALLVILRGLEDTEWWSVYKLGTGVRHLRPAAQFFDPSRHSDHALCGFRSPARDPRSGSADVLFGRTRNSRSADHERRSETGAKSPLVRRCQPLCHARDAR